MPALALPEQVTSPTLAFWGRLDVKPKFWPCPRGSVCLMILIWPQFAISRCSISMSSGFEVKLDPDVRGLPHLLRERATACQPENLRQIDAELGELLRHEGRLIDPIVD